ncbi:cytochrome ubiquinol oxidase subunit I [Streptomyces sp. NPDC051554]|uniref:cytochrome ubiquinol oxidase subunit I n=1 Tax=Streptomyces sp. NPDC051554 TaxID=3365656 RepID=UPI0037B48EAE
MAEFLSRVQFALTAAFHITYPAVTIGLSVFLVGLYAAYWRTGREVYLRAFRFWRRIFAIGFAIGVVAGLVLTFEFGLNWGIFADRAGPVIGPIIGWEVLTAFFLEAGFIGIMLYGDGRVRHGVMLFSCAMVTLGTLFSTTWILVANSWMQTPVGYEIVDGRFQPVNWLHIIFSPSFDYRFTHMLLGALVGAAFFVTGLSVWWVRRNVHLDVARLCLAVGLAAAAVLMPLQIYMGSTNSAKTYGARPGILAAAQGVWYDTTSWPQIIVPNIGAGPGEAPWRSYGIPYLGAYFLNNDPSLTKPISGMVHVPKDERPNVWIVFYAFHLMLWGAMVLFGTTVAATLIRLRGKLWQAHRFHRWLLWLTPLGVVCVICGWVTAEAGRQPWVVYGLLRTKDALSPLSTGQVVTTLSGFVLAYLVLCTLYIRFVVRSVREGPEPAPDPGPGQRSERGTGPEPWPEPKGAGV